MQLVLGQERHPIDSILLVLAQLSVDLDRNLIRFYLITVKQLHQELALVLTASEQVLRKAGRVRQAGLYSLRVNVSFVIKASIGIGRDNSSPPTAPS